MKKLIVVLALLISVFSVQSQTRDQLQRNNTTGIDYNVIGTRKFLYVPLDTLSTADSGAIAFKGGKWWGKDNVGWKDLGSAVDTTSLSNRILLKLSIEDTATMLEGYADLIDTKQPIGAYIETLVGDGTASGPGVANFILAPTGIVAGTYTNPTITFDEKGRAIAVTNGSGGGTGTDNTNIGAFFRLLTSTQQIKTLAPSPTILWDSTSNANALTAKVDTSAGKIATHSMVATKQNLLGYVPEDVANKTNILSNSTTLYPNVNAVKTYTDAGLALKQDLLGFTPENSANRSTNVSLGTSNLQYPTQNAVKVYVDNKFASIPGITVDAFPTLGSSNAVSSNGTAVRLGEKLNLSDTATMLEAYEAALLTKQNLLGFTPENAANKSTSVTLGTSNIAYPTQNAVKVYVDDGLATKQDLLGYTPENVASKSTNTTLGVSNILYPSQNAVKVYVDNGLATKQNTITLTTTGTSGAATFNAGTGVLNIPQYAGATYTPGVRLTLVGNQFNVDSAGLLAPYQTAINTRVKYSDTSAMLLPYANKINTKLENVSAYIQPGTNVTFSGAGTLASPYIVNSTGGGGTGGTDNSMVGVGFRPLNLGTQNLRTYFGGIGIALDSTSNASGLTWRVDTATINAPLITAINTRVKYSDTSAMLLPYLNLISGKGAGTVTSFSFTDGGGFDGTVINTTTTPTLSLTFQNAAADGATKGQAGFVGADFNAASGIISIDWINTQKANTSQSGALSATDWNTFNDKQNPITLTTTGTSGAATFNAGTGVLNIPQYVGTTYTAGTRLTLVGNQFNVDSAGLLAPYQTAINARVRYSDTANMLAPYAAKINTKLENITGKIIAGTNVTITGAGTTASPYEINAAPGGGGSGTVNTGLANRLAYYPANGTVVDDLAAITGNRLLVSDANGLPTHSTVTAIEAGYLVGVTSGIQNQINNKQATLTTGTALQYFKGDLTLGTFPVNVSAFTNDAGYITASSSNTLTNKTWNGAPITDAYIASATIWNAKQNAITLTTTGTSGAATFNAGTGVLNIPQYAGTTYTPGTRLTLVGNQFNVDSAGLLAPYQTAINTRVKYSDTTAMLAPYANKINTKLENVSAYIQPGTNVTFSGAGTIASPYVINSTAAGSKWTQGTGIITYANNVGIGTTVNSGDRLRVVGSVRFDLGSDATGDVFYRASSGSLARLAAPSGITTPVLSYASGAPVWISDGGSGTTINNNANNRIITGSGTANTLEAETNWTINGSSFSASGSAPGMTFTNSDNSESINFGFFNTGSVNEPVLIIKTGSITNGRVLQRQSSTNDLYIGDIDNNGGGIKLRASGVDRAYISSAGVSIASMTTGTGSDSIVVVNNGILKRIAQSTIGGAAAGSTGYLQYNTAGAFDAESNLFWDATNNRLGIGTTSPTSTLSLSNINSNNGTSISLTDNNSAGARPNIIYRRSRGSSGSPTSVAASDFTGSLRFEAYDGTNYIPNAFIAAESVGTIATNSVPGQLRFMTGTGAVALTDRMTINNSGVTINASTDAYTLPTARGTNGQVLTTNGAGGTSWTTVVGGGGDVYLNSSNTFGSNGRLILPQVTDNSTVRIGSMEIQSRPTGIHSLLMNNLYYDGTTYRYRGTSFGTATYYGPGEIIFSTAPSGTAGSPATVTERFKVNSSGQVIINGAYTLPTAAGSANQYLKMPASGTVLEWGTPSGGGSGTVTGGSGGTTGLTLTGSTTLTLGGTLALAHGGTGLTSIGANGTYLKSNGSALSYGTFQTDVRAQFTAGTGISISSGVISATGSNEAQFFASISGATATTMTGALEVSNGEAGYFEVNITAVNPTNTGMYHKKMIIPFSATSTTSITFHTGDYTTISEGSNGSSPLTTLTFTPNYDSNGDLIFTMTNSSGGVTAQGNITVKKFLSVWSS